MTRRCRRRKVRAGVRLRTPSAPPRWSTPRCRTRFENTDDSRSMAKDHDAARAVDGRGRRAARTKKLERVIFVPDRPLPLPPPSPAQAYDKELVHVREKLQQLATKAQPDGGKEADLKADRTRAKLERRVSGFESKLNELDTYNSKLVARSVRRRASRPLDTRPLAAAAARDPGDVAPLSLLCPTTVWSFAWGLLSQPCSRWAASPPPPALPRQAPCASRRRRPPGDEARPSRPREAPGRHGGDQDRVPQGARRARAVGRSRAPARRTRRVTPPTLR